LTYPNRGSTFTAAAARREDHEEGRRFSAALKDILRLPTALFLCAAVILEFCKPTMPGTRVAEGFGVIIQHFDRAGLECRLTGLQVELMSLEGIIRVLQIEV
jgi:hypothetical protein